MADLHLIFEVFSNDQASGVAYKNRVLKRLIINYLDITGNVTIAELSKELNISAPKITNLIAELSEDVARPLETFPTTKWWVCFIAAMLAFAIQVSAIHLFGGPHENLHVPPCFDGLGRGVAQLALGAGGVGQFGTEQCLHPALRPRPARRHRAQHHDRQHVLYLRHGVRRREQRFQQQRPLGRRLVRCCLDRCLEHRQRGVRRQSLPAGLRQRGQFNVRGHRFGHQRLQLRHAPQPLVHRHRQDPGRPDRHGAGHCGRRPG